MLSVSQARDKAEKLIDQARAAGAGLTREAATVMAARALSEAKGREPALV